MVKTFKLQSEVSRGLANGSTYIEMAKQIATGMNSPFKRALSNAMRIARTEGHRVQMQSQLDALTEAEKNGAEIVKQWDATLDGRTRPEHQEADGQIRELDEFFDVGGEKLKAPGIGGSAHNVVNCRCCMLQRARWALDQDELETLEERAKFYGLDKSEDFSDYKDKYLVATANDSDDILTKEKVVEKAMEFAQSSDYDHVQTFADVRSVTNAKLGYDVLPMVVSSGDFDSIAEHQTVLYRGVHSTTGKTSKEIADEFKYGALWTGNSGGAVFGNGVYFTSTREVAESVDYFGTNGSLIEMTLFPSSQVADYREISVEWSETFRELTKSGKMEARQILADVGQYAAIKGYDAIALNGYQGKDYVILLNRGIAVIKE